MLRVAMFVGLLALYASVSAQELEQGDVNEGYAIYYYNMIVMMEYDYYNDIGEICHKAYKPMELAMISIFGAVQNFYFVEFEELKDFPVTDFVEPDFSTFTSADLCDDYPIVWQVDCLNAVAANLVGEVSVLEEEVSELEEDVSELVALEITMFQLEMAGSTIMVLFLLLTVIFCSLCCSKSKKRGPEQLEYIYLQPIPTEV